MVCRIIDLFNTSVGLIAIIDFPENMHPWVHTILRDKFNNEFKITGIGRDAKQNPDTAYAEMPEIQSAWDCRIEAVEHKKNLSVGESLEILNM